MSAAPPVSAEESPGEQHHTGERGQTNEEVVGLAGDVLAVRVEAHAISIVAPHGNSASLPCRWHRHDHP